MRWRLNVHRGRHLFSLDLIDGKAARQRTKGTMQAGEPALFATVRMRSPLHVELSVGTLQSAHRNCPSISCTYVQKGGSLSRIRTYDQVINSHLLYR
jgi:hypothetical protein